MLISSVALSHLTGRASPSFLFEFWQPVVYGNDALGQDPRGLSGAREGEVAGDSSGPRAPERWGAREGGREAWRGLGSKDIEWLVGSGSHEAGRAQEERDPEGGTASRQFSPQGVGGRHFPSQGAKAGLEDVSATPPQYIRRVGLGLPGRALSCRQHTTWTGGILTSLSLG